MASHDDADIDAGQRAEIEIDAEERGGDELAGRNEARRMVVVDQVVVDGLGRMHEGHRAAGRLGQDLLRAGGVVAADIDEGVGADLLQAGQHHLAIGGVRLVAGAAEGGARRAGDQPQLRFGNRGQVDIVAVADAAHAVARAQHFGAGMALLRLQHRAGQRLVDDGGRAASLRDHEGRRHAENPPVSNADCFKPTWRAATKGATRNWEEGFSRRRSASCRTPG